MYVAKCMSWANVKFFRFSCFLAIINVKNEKYFPFQVIDNHVIRYIPPEEFHPPRTSVRNPKSKRHLGCLLIGAESADPQTVCTSYKFILY
jgi:hypothetical protein